MQVYNQAIDWAYANPKAIRYFAEFAKAPRDIAKQAVDDSFHARGRCRSAKSATSISRLKDALQYKFVTSALTPKDVEGMIDILYKPPAK
jgi:NitT/TauT family transport system substrate-binding protein